MLAMLAGVAAVELGERVCVGVVGGDSVRLRRTLFMDSDDEKGDWSGLGRGGTAGFDFLSIGKQSLTRRVVEPRPFSPKTLQLHPPAELWMHTAGSRSSLVSE